MKECAFGAGQMKFYVEAIVYQTTTHGTPHNRPIRALVSVVKPLMSFRCLARMGKVLLSGRHDLQTHRAE
jgi:hypothetical protein